MNSFADVPGPRRVLVVGRTSGAAALQAAFAARAFTVENASDPDDALRRLSDDLDGFDLLVVDGARDDGDVLVRTVRRGGESDLAIVVVASAAQPASVLERAGADAVLDRSLGVELLARASDAVLKRKRGGAAC